MSQGGQRRREIAYLQTGHPLKVGGDAALCGEPRQYGELVEGATRVGVRADDIVSRSAELGQHNFIRSAMFFKLNGG